VSSWANPKSTNIEAAYRPAAPVEWLRQSTPNSPKSASPKTIHVRTLSTQPVNHRQ